MRGRFDRKAANALEERYQALLGGYGTTTRLSRALGTSRQQLHKVWTAKSGLPEYLLAIAELLEVLPEDQWPERWGKNTKAEGG